MTTTTKLNEAMAQVGTAWPHAPAFTASELEQWRRAADEYAEEWATALKRCKAQRGSGPHPDRARFRPDLDEILEMCRAIRGPYRPLSDAPSDGERGPITPKDAAVERVRSLRKLVR